MDNEFFTQLVAFSVRVFQKLGLSVRSPWPVRSPWGDDSWTGDEPRGAILHYTADSAVEQSVRWFMDPKFNAKASAHVVIGDVPVDWMTALAVDLPLIAALKVPVVQCRPPNMTAWHATWTCPKTFGVELTNVGELHKLVDGGFTWWGKNWTEPWGGRVPVQSFGRWWCPWTLSQIQAVVEVLRQAQAYYGTFRRPWVLGHEQVQGVATLKRLGPSPVPLGTDKRDPGPLFPLEWIRGALFDDRKEPGEDFVLKQDAYAANTRLWWLRQWAGSPIMATDAAYHAFQNQLVILPHTDPFGTVGKLALKLLGYHVGNVTSDILEGDDFESVRIFQRLMGLTVDGVPGPITRQALIARLQDRGLIS